MPGGQGKLSKLHGRVLADRLHGLTLKDIAAKEGVGQTAIHYRLQTIKPYLHPNTLRRLQSLPIIPGRSLKHTHGEGLTPEHKLIIQQRLRGKQFKDIGRELGIRYHRVWTRLREALPLLDEETVRKLNLRMRVPAKTPLKRQKVADEFFRQLAASVHTLGIMRKTAKNSDVRYEMLRHYLTGAGVNWRGELQRKRLELALKISSTMHLSERKAAKQIGISNRTTHDYRKMVQRGEHLRGALELVEHPESTEWWEIAPVIEGAGSTARINLGVRNESMLKDLATFDKAIEEAKQLMVKWHPDRRKTEKARQIFRNASELRVRLKKGRGEYVKREIKFRERFKIPIHVALEK